MTLRRHGAGTAQATSAMRAADETHGVAGPADRAYPAGWPGSCPYQQKRWRRLPASRSHRFWCEIPGQSAARLIITRMTECRGDDYVKSANDVFKLIRVALAGGSGARRSVADGNSPNIREYSPANRPNSQKPWSVATTVTVVLVASARARDRRA